MASSLGLYIEDNLIKYAKVTKNNEAIKVESFGIKFYDDIEKTIKQIVEETYSYKIPISINTTEEMYNKLEVFSLLSKKDIDNVIKTEFENVCYDKGVNMNVYESRYILTNSNSNNEKIKAIHISVPKTAIAQRKNQFSKYKVNAITPVSIAISNLVKKEKNNIIIVNIENSTTITKISSTGVTDIINIQIGANNILSNIKKKENSYSKAYEICKNTTIYTENDRDLQYEENDYLEDIMPTCFQIVSEVSRITEESIETISKVYITGTAAIINNLDIYFQNSLKDIPCEVLKPSFISNNSKINIKDYIEVNSAIAIALQGVEKKNAINFTKETGWDKAKALLKSDISADTNTKIISAVNEFLDKFERQYNIITFTLTFITIIYLVGTCIINGRFNKKIEVAEKVVQDTNTRISKIKEYNTKFNNQITNYQTMIDNIQNINNSNSEDKRYKNTIPILLNNLMSVIPKSVQLTSIENTSDTHIVIKAQSTKYEQVAFFKTKLKTDGILKNIVSDTGTMQSGNLSVTIEGELP